MAQKKKKANANNNGSTSPKKKTARKKVAKKNDSPNLVELPIVRVIPNSEKSVYANHFVVRSDPSYCQFFFFDIEPPLVSLEDSEEIKNAVSNMKYLEAPCVSRVAVPTHLIPDIIQALQTNYDRNKERAEKNEATTDKTGE